MRRRKKQLLFINGIFTKRRVLKYTPGITATKYPRELGRAFLVPCFPKHKKKIKAVFHYCNNKVRTAQKICS